jgi:hypothetical protein
VKLYIGDQSYPWGGQNKVPLIHMIRVQRELGIGQNELGAMYKEEQALRDKYLADLEIAKNTGVELPEEPAPDLFLLGITVWLARMAAGEKLDFEEACGFDIRDLRFEAEPGDVDAGEPVDPTTGDTKPLKNSGKSKRPVEAVA